MRTKVEIDDDLLDEAMAATGSPTKKAAVMEALRRVVLERKRRDAITAAAGIGWTGNLDNMRAGRQAP